MCYSVISAAVTRNSAVSDACGVRLTRWDPAPPDDRTQLRPITSDPADARTPTVHPHASRPDSPGSRGRGGEGWRAEGVVGERVRGVGEGGLQQLETWVKCGWLWSGTAHALAQARPLSHRDPVRHRLPGHTCRGERTRLWAHCCRGKGGPCVMQVGPASACGTTPPPTEHDSRSVREHRAKGRTTRSRGARGCSVSTFSVAQTRLPFHMKHVDWWATIFP